MPVTLEGPVAIAELPNGNKLVIIETGPGMHYQLQLEPQAAADLGKALQGTSVLVPPPGFLPPQNGSPS
jgi:hypothetical protein